MPNTEDLKQTVRELREAAAAVGEAAGRLSRQLFGDEERLPEDAGAEKEPVRQIRLEDVRAVLAEKSRRGRTAEVRELLKRHGADRLSQIEPRFYGELLREAEEIEDGK